jgi:hypothetical protein
MDALTNYFQEFDMSKAADLLSVVTFLLAIYVSLAVRNVKNNYLFRARAPGLVKNLSKQASQLSEFGEERGKNAHEIAVLMGQIDVSLSSLKKKTARGWGRGRTISRTRKKIKAYLKLPGEDRFWDVYAEAHKVIAETNQILQDDKWEN